VLVARHRPRRRGLLFEAQITFWLWLTVWFANFAEALAEGRGQGAGRFAAAARGTQTTARRLRADGSTETVPATALRKGDRVVVEAGEFIRPMAKSSPASHPSTSRRSPASRRRSSASRAAIGPRSPVARACSRTRIEVQVTSDPGRRFSIA
jgi:K+-transporting ATPase ATPase B chain